MTPDNLPFLGRCEAIPGVWIAQAIWITHAAGAAAKLVHALTTDSDLPRELAVDRFLKRTPQMLHEEALKRYRDIYVSEAEI